MSTEKMEEPQTEQSVDRTEAQLVEQVKNQVEYYFSKENLMSDPFLSSQMDAQMCVPISVVMKFAKLKALTHDESILRKALVDSTAVSIVDNKIKANIKPPGRSTIILREIPSDASEEEVKEIFNYPGAKPVSSLRSEIGDTWFVTMESEEDAKDTLLDLRLKKRTFRGAAVKGRLKTETVVRSFFPVQTAMAPVVPFPGMMPAVGMPVVDMRAFGYMGVPVPVLAPVDPSVVDPSVVAGADSHAAGAAQGAGAAAAGETRSPTKGQATTPSAGNKDARGKGANSASTSGNNAKGGNNAQGRRQDGKESAAGSNGRTKGASKEKKEEAAPRPTIELNLASFPPLGGEDTPVPTPGYKGAFLKYSGDEIINIAKAVKEAKLPEALNPAQHPLAMTAEPNKDLLKRQRTFSIDETREQLRQGRPVQREAILPGKVDSRSLYYGDEPAAAAPAHKKESSAGAPAAPVTTPSAAKKEATAAAADVVEQVTSAAAALAVGDSASPVPAVVEPMNASAPQTITPSSWAAMLKSSASAADAVGAKPAVSLPVKRTPAKAPAAEAKAAGSSSAVKPSGKGDAKEKDGETRRKKGEGKDKEGASPRKEGRRRTGSNDAAASRPEKAASAEEGDKTEAAAPAAAATSSWGGKASFANILKLNADAEAFQPTASSVSPKPAASASTAAPAASSSSSGDRRRAPQQSSGSTPSKPTASAVAAASKRSEASSNSKSSSAAADASSGDNGEWSTSTGRARNHRNNNNSEHRERGEGRERGDREHRDRGDREHRERGDREHRGDRGDREGRPAAGSGSTATSGANAKGAWARETLPPVAAKEEK